MVSKFLLISGASDTGKSTVIGCIDNYLRNDKKFVEQNRFKITQDENAFILEGVDNTGTKIRIFINYPADNTTIINKVYSCYDKEKTSCDIVISSIRDMDWERDEVLKIFNIIKHDTTEIPDPIIVEIPIAKITRRNNRTKILQDYHSRVFKLAKNVLSSSLFNI